MSDSQDDTSPPDALDKYLSVLVDESRRIIVKILAEEDRPIPLSLLAGWLSAGRQNAPLDALTERKLRRTELRLHHAHLPRLDAVGAVDYCYESGRIAPGENLGTVRSLLDP